MQIPSPELSLLPPHFADLASHRLRGTGTTASSHPVGTWFVQANVKQRLSTFLFLLPSAQLIYARVPVAHLLLASLKT